MCRCSLPGLALVVLMSAYWVLVTDAAELFNSEDTNNQESEDGFLRMLREMLGFQQGGKRADTNDFPAVPGFMGARGRRFSPAKRSNDISPPPGFMGARGKRRDAEDYSDNYLSAARG